MLWIFSVFNLTRIKRDGIKRRQYCRFVWVIKLRNVLKIGVIFKLVELMNL